MGYGEYVPPISYDSLSGDLEGAFSNHNNDDNKSQNRIIACHGVGSDLRMYVQQSDFTIHSTSEHLDKILMSDESCDYFYKIRIPQQIRKQSPDWNAAGQTAGRLLSSMKSFITASHWTMSASVRQSLNFGLDWS